MKDRSIKELLQLMLDSEHLFTSGLCPLQVRLRDMRMIAPSEDILLRKFLMDNLPPNTFLHPFGITGIPNYAFPFGEWPPREQWLKEQIEKL